MSPIAILLIAAGGAMFFEGVVWAVFPGGVRKLYQDVISQLPDKDLHISGLISVFFGVVLITLALKIGA